MARLRYLVRIQNQRGLTPSDRDEVGETTRAVLGGIATVGTVRIGSKALEIDFFIRDSGVVGSAVDRLRSSLGSVILCRQLDVPPAPKSKEDKLREGIDLFNEERYWESHQVFEEMWLAAGGKKSEDPEAAMLQGVIQVAAAFVHQQKGEYDVGLFILRKAGDKLDAWRGERYMSLDVASLKGKVAAVIRSGRMSTFRL